MEWLRQLSQAIDYIENNLAGDISYEEAAKIAHCSTYYFQRMFSYVAGIPLSEYIRRRRMTAAAFELQTTDQKVMEIGLKYGYESPTAFNRAFQSVHGVSPVVARAQGTLLNAFPPISFSVVVSGSESMRYRIEAKDTIRFVGVKTGLTEDMEQNQKTVPVFWNQILESKQFKEICNLTDKKPNCIFGVTACKEPQNICYYICVSTDKPVPDEMEEFEVPAATWVIFECNGDYRESVQTVFRRFLTEWLPFSCYEYAMLPDIEVYPIDEKKSKAGHVQVWIAIKNRNINGGESN